MGLPGSLVFGRMHGVGPPPLASMAWLVVALVPVSALFSALCLALAAFARSTKEGQYYLMPLLLVTMPLAILPMVSGHGVEPRDEPDSGHGDRAAVASGAGGTLPAGAAVPAAGAHAVTLVCCCWRFAGRSTSSTPSRSSSARASGWTWGSGSATSSATGSRRPPWPGPLLRNRDPAGPLLHEFCTPLADRIERCDGDGPDYPGVVVLLPAALMTALLPAARAQTLLLRLPPWAQCRSRPQSPWPCRCTRWPADFAPSCSTSIPSTRR